MEGAGGGTPGGWRWVLLIAIVVVAVLSGLFSIFAVTRFRAAEAWVQHTITVQAQLETIRTRLLGAESAQRGYLITGGQGELDQFHARAAEVMVPIDAVRMLTRDNPSQQRRIAEVERLARGRLEHLEATVRLRASGEQDAAIERIRRGDGKLLTVEVLRLTEEGIAEEARLLEARNRTASATGTIATVLSAITLGACVALVVLGVVVSRDLVRANEATRAANAQLERRVQERTRELQDANQGLESFGYSVSHDLRAPLRSVHGFASALREDYSEQLPAEGVAYIARIQAAASRMDQLIQDLLNYSRLSRAQVQVRPVSLTKAIEQALAQATPPAGTPPPVDVRVGPDLVMAESVVLTQVLTNLITNALKFTRPGESPRVAVTSVMQAGVVRVSVRDEGIGIDPEHHDRIFRVFERLHNTEQYPGTGIGLAIVRKGVERMGGRVGLESAPGAGSTFWFELPSGEAA